MNYQASISITWHFCYFETEKMFAYRRVLFAEDKDKLFMIEQLIQN